MERNERPVFRPAPILEFDTIEALDVLMSPLRVRLLACFRDPSTVKSAAEKLDVRVTRLYHHVNRLVEHGFLVPVEERTVAKTVERVYSIAAVTVRPSAAFYERYGVEGNAELFRLGFRTVESEVVAAALADSALDPQGEQAAFSFTRLHLDEADLEKLVEAVEGLFDQFRTRSGDIEVSFLASVIPLNQENQRSHS